MITNDDVKVDGSTWEISLCKLIGKKVKDIRGYISPEFGDMSFKLSHIVFDDDSEMSVEGEHDFPYLAETPRFEQPNFDQETLRRLYEEDPFR
jgi:hypothetical protein